MLTDEIAQNLAKSVTDSLKSLKDTDPKATWTVIFTELFKSLKENGVIEVNQMGAIEVLSTTLISPPTGGPASGVISEPSTVYLKGKIT